MMAEKSCQGHQKSSTEPVYRVRFGGTSSTPENQIQGLANSAEVWQPQISQFAGEQVVIDNGCDPFALPGSSREAQGEDDKLSVAAGGCCLGSSTAKDVPGRQQATDSGGCLDTKQVSVPSIIVTASAQVTFPGYSPGDAPTGGLASNTKGDASLTSLCMQPQMPVPACTGGTDLLAAHVVMKAQAESGEALVVQNEIHTESESLSVPHASFVWSDHSLFLQNLPPVPESALVASPFSEQQPSKHEEMVLNDVSRRAYLAQVIFSEHALAINNSPPIAEVGPDVCGAGNAGAEDDDKSDDDEEELESDDGEFVDLQQAQHEACLHCRTCQREVTLLPCSHKVVCYTCFRRLCNHHQGVWPCLICSRHFQGIRLSPAVYARFAIRLVARRRIRDRRSWCWKGG